MKDVKVFGLGLGLIISAIMFLRTGVLHGNFWGFLAFIVFVLFVISKSLEWPWLFALVYAALTAKWLLSGNISLPAGILAIIGLALIAVASFRPQVLEPFYRLWMKAAHAIGLVFTTIILGAVYFTVFSLVRFILLMAGKDHMDRRWDPKAGSYWIKRETTGTDKSRYGKQF